MVIDDPAIYSVSPFSVGMLILPTVFILLSGFIVGLLVTRSVIWSVVVALLKSSCFLLYFSNFFDGTFNFLDDWSYYRGGLDLTEKGVSVFNFLGYLPELSALAGGKHIAYYVYNADAIRLLGEGYFAPVALNVFLTFIVAATMVVVAKSSFGLSRRVAIALFVMTALHPSLLAWSTIINAKDFLILTCTSLVIYAVSRIELGLYAKAIFLFLFLSCILWITRYYLPLIMLLAFFGALFLSRKIRIGKMFWLFLLGSFLSLLSVVDISGSISHFLSGVTNPLIGAVRFILTPMPFNTGIKYEFLDVPQLFHWMLLPFLFLGGVIIWRRGTLTAYFVVIYFILMVLFYGMFQELQGPRHRIQLEGLIALFQFYGVLTFLRQTVSTQSRHVRN